MTTQEALKQAKETYKELVGDSAIGDTGTETDKVQAIIAIARFLKDNEKVAIR